MSNLTLWDVILTPVYLLILNALAKRYRNRRFPKGHPLRNYYLKGLYVKFAGAILIALLYEFYYEGGDTYNFFGHSRIINSALQDSYETWFQLLLRRSPVDNPTLYTYTAPMIWYNDPSSYMVGVIGAILGLLNGTTYIPIALLFAYLSYTGMWAMYYTFVNIYPKLYKELAIAFLFVPSTFIWGSAIFKDTLCMFGLGWLTYTTFRIFVNKDTSFRNLLLLAFSIYLIAIIKLYILIAFLPALSLWLLLTYSHRIKSAPLKWLVNIIFIGITAGAFAFFANRFADRLEGYSLDNVAKTANKTRTWIAYVSETQEGSGYDLGEFDPTLLGMLSKFPAAVIVTLYRPFLWEAKKPIVAFSALESLAFLTLTFSVFRRNGIKGTIKAIANDPNLIFFLVFSLIFAFAVGISTYNFGSLSRYKIPCIPFFTALLLILYNRKNVLQNKKINEGKQKRPVYNIARF